MNIILLSGGSGERLWPLSNDVKSKQFIEILKNQDGNYESMVQRVYNQIKKIDSNAKITIATARTQVNLIKEQLNNLVNISVEPARRDTFPAIVLATVYIHEVLGIDKNDAVVICPVDQYVDDTYFDTLKKIYNLALKSKNNLSLMGIEPKYPSEKFGYIIPKNNDEICEVKSFKEKPTKEAAEEYIKNNALWNAGVFAYKIEYLLSKAHELINFKDYKDLLNKYESLEKISFDYAVVEKEKNINVIRYNGLWDDLGTWNALINKLDDKTIGKVYLDESSTNTEVINKLNIPILAVGLKNLVITLTEDGLLVADKGQVDTIKKHVEKIKEIK